MFYNNYNYSEIILLSVAPFFRPTLCVFYYNTHTSMYLLFNKKMSMLLQVLVALTLSLTMEV